MYLKAVYRRVPALESLSRLALDFSCLVQKKHTEGYIPFLLWMYPIKYVLECRPYGSTMRLSTSYGYQDDRLYGYSVKSSSVPLRCHSVDISSMGCLDKDVTLV